MTNVNFTPNLQAPIGLTPPSAFVAVGSDPPSAGGKTSPVPAAGIVSLLGAAVRTGLGVAPNVGAVGVTGLAAVVTPRQATLANPATQSALMIGQNALVTLSSAPAGLQPLGVNLSGGPHYYTTEFPFLNFMKQAGRSAGKAADNFTCWFTADSSNNHTNEEAWLDLDANGYARSLTATAAIPGGQKYTQLTTTILLQTGSISGTPYRYPPGLYRFRWIGKGTLSFQNGQEVDSTTVGPWTNTSANTYMTVTVKLKDPVGNGGVFLIESSIPDSTDYPRDFTFVRADPVYGDYTALYDSGERWNPDFLSSIQPYATGIRTMDWQNTNGEFSFRTYNASAIIPAGATSAFIGTGYDVQSLSAGAVKATLSNNWAGAAGAQSATFNNGDVRTVTFTVGSKAITWVGGLSAGGSAGSLTVAGTVFSLNSAIIPAGTTTISLTTAWPNASGTQQCTFTTNEVRTGTFVNGSKDVTLSSALTLDTTSTTVLTDFPSTWSHPTGTYYTIFNGGDVLPVTFTAGSNVVQWTTPTTNTSYFNTNSEATFNVSWKQSFATRPTPNYISFGNGGITIPLELLVDLCNRLGADLFSTMPIQYVENEMRGYENSMTQYAQFVHANLNAPLKWIVHITNEPWNFAFTQEFVAYYLGRGFWATVSGGQNATWNQNWLGMRSAQMADVCQTVWGTDFTPRCFPAVNVQAATTSGFTNVMTTPYWTGNQAKNHPIRIASIAPYFGGTYTQAEQTQILQCADPLAEFFSLAKSNVGAVTGLTYTSMGAGQTGGWFGRSQAWVNSYKTLLASTYPSMFLNCYECGPSWLNGPIIGTAANQMQAAFQDLLSGTPDVNGVNQGGAFRDTRMGQMLLDWFSWWKANVGASAVNNQYMFSDCGAIPRAAVGTSNSGAWGNIEQIWQPRIPTTVAPPRWQACVAYANNQATLATFDFFVGPTGSDSNAGTLASPWAITSLDARSANHIKIAGRRVGLLDGTYVVNAAPVIIGGGFGYYFQLTASGSPSAHTVVQAVNPRAATITLFNSVTGLYQQNITAGSGGSRADVLWLAANYVDLKDIVFDKTNCGAMVRCFDTGANTGCFIGITGCQFSNVDVGILYNNQGTPSDNIAALYLHEVGDNQGTNITVSNCYFNLVKNNVATGTAGAFNANAMSGFQYTNVVINNCEFANTFSAYYPKGKMGYYQFYYNFVHDCAAMLRDSNEAWPTYNSPVAAVPRIQIHHNVTFNVGGLSSGSAGNPAQVNVDIYNNTFCFDSRLGFRQFQIYSATGDGVYQSTPQPTTSKFYNNIFFSQVATPGKTYMWDSSVVTVGVALTYSSVFSLMDYNCHTNKNSNYFEVESRAPTVFDDVGIAAWRTRSGFEAHSIQSDPTFTSVPAATDPKLVKLAAGSACLTAGTSDGTSTGAVVAQGAWGGTVAPVDIGVSWRGY